MELQFDKEMDAILRRARDSRGVLVGDDPSKPKKHLDADVIAAFAENAVPPKARLLYMEHFADCDSCRRMLSQSILLNSEAVAAAAFSDVSAPVASVVPWYSKLFRTPNLALAMGALVLTFGGVLGYLVLQNRNEGATSVAKVTDKQPEHTYSASEPAANATVANSVNKPAADAVAANMSAASNAPASDPAGSVSGPSPVKEEATLVGRSDVTGAGSGSVDTHSKAGETEGVSPEPAKPVLAAPPPPPPTTQPRDERDEKKPVSEKMKDDAAREVMSKTPPADETYDRGAAISPKKTGPNRGAISGPRNVQQQSESNTQNAIVNNDMVSPTRTAGGKTFESLDGIWYDRSYNGQATSNYRRGTAEYKKLDGGLRKIADSIGGTVILMWKSKAYRIQ